MLTRTFIHIALATSLFACSSAAEGEQDTSEGASVITPAEVTAPIVRAHQVVATKAKAGVNASNAQRLDDVEYLGSVGLSRKVNAIIAAIKPDTAAVHPACAELPMTLQFYISEDSAALGTLKTKCGVGTLSSSGGVTQPVTLDVATVMRVLAEKRTLGDSIWNYGGIVVQKSSGEELQSVERAAGANLIEAVNFDQPVREQAPPTGRASVFIQFTAMGEAMNSIDLHVNAANPKQSLGVFRSVTPWDGKSSINGLVDIDATPFLR